MSRLLHKTPQWIQNLYPNFTWQVATEKKEIFLTFDDGPVPKVTEYVLEILGQYQASGTFFCVGENLQKYPEIAARIVNEGHSIGNHTFNHLKGWQTRNFRYLKNVIRSEREIEKFQKSLNLFRPPYGRIKRVQAKVLSRYQIVMWNRLAWDFDPKLNIDRAIMHLNDDAPVGSIFVFHDNVKSYVNMKEILPEVLKYYGERQYIFSSLGLHKGTSKS